MRDTLRWLAPAAFGAACVVGGSFLPGENWGGTLLVCLGVLFLFGALGRLGEGRE